MPGSEGETTFWAVRTGSLAGEDPSLLAHTPDKESPTNDIDPSISQASRQCTRPRSFNPNQPDLRAWDDVLRPPSLSPVRRKEGEVRRPWDMTWD